MNDALEDLLNGLAGRSVLLDRAMTLAATDLIVLVGLVLLALWFWPAAGGRATNQRLVAAAMVGVLSALAVGSVIGALHPEARPFVTDGSTRLLLHHAADNGLPSDHALVSFAIAGTLLWWRRTLGWLIVVAGVAIGTARIYVGVHWPGDILVGALVGLLAGSLAAQTVPWWTGPQRWAGRFLSPYLLDRP
jgi:undecaprenyl-diphosphatase